VGSIPTPGTRTMDTQYGNVIHELPEGFVPREQWPEYALAADVPPLLAPRVVGKRPVGMYRRFWPIVVEEYISDEEPVLADSDPSGVALNRMIIWQRLCRSDVPRGWRVFSSEPTRLEGFAEIQQGEYWHQWSESARRYRKKWHEECLGSRYRISAVSYADFERAYKKSTVVKVVKNSLLDVIKRKLALPEGKHIELWCAESLETGEFVAGMATITSPTCHGSHYISGFVTQAAGKDPAMVGLMDHWFHISHARGVRFLHFGGFWTKGSPENWKGFSLFKSKFGLKYIACPSPLFRFQRGRLF
jgi:hypothetical protein